MANITIKLGNDSWNVISEAPAGDHTLCFDIVDVENVFPHEVVIGTGDESKKLTDSLADSMIKNHFFHPILMSKPGKYYVIADGTHRKEALLRIKEMKGLSELQIIGVNLSDFWRDAWVKTFDKLSLSGYELEEIKIRSPEDIRVTYANPDSDAIAIARISGAYYKVKYIFEDVKSYLAAVRKIDVDTGVSGFYHTVEEAFDMDTDALIPFPPKEEEMDYLVQYPELRRIKGSRTMLKLRPMFLPIPIDVLKLPRAECRKGISEIITTLLESGKAYLARPGLSNLDFCKENWDHWLLIFDEDTVMKMTDESQHEDIKKNLIPVRLT